MVIDARRDRADGREIAGLADEYDALEAERARHEAELRIAKSEAERVKTAREKAPDLITPQASDTAEARLAKAEAAPNRTPYENFLIQQMRGSAAVVAGASRVTSDQCPTTTIDLT